MKNIIILLLSIIEAYSFEQNSTNHKGLIYNGVKYDPKEFPYVVSILIYNETRQSHDICTGALIRTYFVMTAAHCVFNKSLEALEVYSGPYDYIKFQNVEKYYIPKNYDNDSPAVVADICLLQLKNPFPTVKKFIEIGGHPDEFANDAAVKCTNIGFGGIDNKGNMGSEGLRMDTKVKYGENACKVQVGKNICVRKLERGKWHVKEIAEVQ
ncbi:mite allergen Der f 3-like isoform X2 [Acyrthosiphon pisum]|uniref:Peptidase S1 domain-containing protein n=1 Tax=Acyrthosiphon pisum TaxID=7029 RepID=A0A8R2B5T1_ACYPI|nr:mite allergen Der f 3-like isoform X2 [Acyrthosiphon pisum]|eukprot:XP_008183065.1 PREDICTED: mite allergen Der f 3-like isoform X2 [Acyrthosiphon pisum]